MQIVNVGSNMTELVTEKGAILFSYSTPVAARLWENHGCNYYRTSKFHSVTTSRHINKWLGSHTAQSMPQTFFDDLVPG